MRADQTSKRRFIRPLSNGPSRNSLLPQIVANSPKTASSRKYASKDRYNSPTRMSSTKSRAPLANLDFLQSSNNNHHYQHHHRLPHQKASRNISPKSAKGINVATNSSSQNQMPIISKSSSQVSPLIADDSHPPVTAAALAPTATTTTTATTVQSKSMEENLRELLEIFNKFDSKQIGLIELNSLPEVFSDLQQPIQSPDPKSMIERYRSHSKTKEGYLSFDELLGIVSNEQSLTQQTQLSQSPSQPQTQLKFDSKVQEYLKILGEYRKKCEDEGNYSDARKAHEKICEVKRKEQIRQKNALRLLQETELRDFDGNQRTALEEFAKTWDAFIAEYEATAYLSLEKMKERHQAEIETFVQELKDEFVAKMKTSKQVLALRHKEKLLVKMKSYSEAEDVKEKADQLQEQENSKNQQAIKEKIEMRVGALRKTQTQVMQALMKRIQTDRLHQIQQRQMEQVKLVNRNRHVRNDLVHRQSAEVKKAMESIKENLNSQDDNDNDDNDKQHPQTHSSVSYIAPVNSSSNSEGGGAEQLPLSPPDGIVLANDRYKIDAKLIGVSSSKQQLQKGVGGGGGQQQKARSKSYTGRKMREKADHHSQHQNTFMAKSMMHQQDFVF